MQTSLLILVGLAIIGYGLVRAPHRVRPTWSRHLKGWRKLFAFIAVVLTILIILNPEFLALGLVGDTAFFDMLVLALGLQMHAYATQGGRWLVRTVVRGLRCVGIPSPGLSYLLAFSTIAFGSAVSAFQKAVHRISS